MRREYASIGAMAALLVGSQAVAIALSPLFQGSGYQAFPNPSDVTNTVVYVILILVVTAAGVTAILGISFGAIPAILLLVALAFYDAWAVYRTKHMITLADELTSQRLPILLVIPKKAGYSFREQKSLKGQIAAGEEREAMFIGLGDLIIPGTMSVSAFTFLTAPGRSILGLETQADGRLLSAVPQETEAGDRPGAAVRVHRGPATEALPHERGEPEGAHPERGVRQRPRSPHIRDEESQDRHGEGEPLESELRDAAHHHPGRDDPDGNRTRAGHVQARPAWRDQRRPA